MSNYNELIGETCSTDAGEYTIVAHVHDDGCCDESINLYVGRAADGHHDMIASDNASMWVVGNEDDAELNRDQWDAIAARCDVAPVINEVRKLDAELADWLAARYEESKRGSIGDRFPPCHDPELRWIPGDYDSIHIESGLNPLSDGEETVCKFIGVDDFCERAGDCSPETILTDAEWSAVLRSMAEG